LPPAKPPTSLQTWRAPPFTFISLFHHVRFFFLIPHPSDAKHGIKPHLRSRTWLSLVDLPSQSFLRVPKQILFGPSSEALFQIWAKRRGPNLRSFCLSLARDYYDPTAGHENFQTSKFFPDCSFWEPIFLLSRIRHCGTHHFPHSVRQFLHTLSTPQTIKCTPRFFWQSFL